MFILNEACWQLIVLVIPFLLLLLLPVACRALVLDFCSWLCLFCIVRFSSQILYSIIFGFNTSLLLYVTFWLYVLCSVITFPAGSFHYRNLIARAADGRIGVRVLSATPSARNPSSGFREAESFHYACHRAYRNIRSGEPSALKIKVAV
jgi:hypothetical protein